MPFISLMAASGLESLLGKHVPAVHTGLSLLVALSVASSEIGKTVWARLWLNRDHGYWWVGPYGFSVGATGCGGLLLDTGAALLAALLCLSLVLAFLRRAAGCTVALAVHVLVAVLLCVLAGADLALAVGAGGARVSLPLVLFVLSEPGYIAKVVQPWLHILAFCFVGICVVALIVGPCLFRLLLRLPLGLRLPWLAKAMLVGICIARLSWRRRGEDATSHDLISQLVVDAAAMARGSLKLVPTSDVLQEHTVTVAESRSAYPPLLIFHWEAGMAALLERALATNVTEDSPLPFLRSLADRGDVLLHSAFVTVPMTLKSAWEALCGTPPALTSDFREHASALRRECLPRLLARCCGYRSILVKTDSQLPDLPRRVFGFQEVIVAPTNVEVLASLRARLAELDALSGARPVLVYFYAGDAHAPYTADRVQPEERGRAKGTAEDVFLALSRRSDDTAAALSAFWPPPRPAGTPWRLEHGLALYFGDHGELLWDAADVPPHGNSVAPEVTRVLLAVERRSFGGLLRAEGTFGGAGYRGHQELRRLADVFSTIVDCTGLVASGQLHVGESLLQPGRRKELTSFSFYRPAELVALHQREATGRVLSLELTRSPDGWRDVGGRPCNGPDSPDDVAAGCGALQLERLRTALAARDIINTYITESNVHAAWLFARFAAAARHLLRVALGKWLPAPEQFGFCNATTESASCTAVL